LVGSLSAGNGINSTAGNGEEALGAAAALRGGITRARGEKTFFGEAIEGRVECADGRLTSDAGLDFGADGEAVGVVAEAKDSEDNDLFELTETGGLSHLFHRIEQIKGIDNNEFFRGRFSSRGGARSTMNEASLARAFNPLILARPLSWGFAPGYDSANLWSATSSPFQLS
jgi:hypothetical protein